MPGKLTRQEALELLDVEDGASETQLKQAWKRMALKWHPDKNPGEDTTETFQRINAAYEKLMKGEADEDDDDFDVMNDEDMAEVFRDFMEAAMAAHMFGAGGRGGFRFPGGGRRGGGGRGFSFYMDQMFGADPFDDGPFFSSRSRGRPRFGKKKAKRRAFRDEYESEESSDDEYGRPRTQAPPRPPKKSLTAEELRKEGNDAFAKGQLAAAIRHYTNALERLDPNDELKPHVLLSNRSAAYVRHGLIPQAIADARECVRTAPDWGKGYQRLGIALKENGDLEEAVEALSTAVGLIDEDSAAAVRGLLEEARASLKQREEEEALAARLAEKEAASQAKREAQRAAREAKREAERAEKAKAAKAKRDAREKQRKAQEEAEAAERKAAADAVRAAEEEAAEVARRKAAAEAAEKAAAEKAAAEKAVAEQAAAAAAANTTRADAKDAEPSPDAPPEHRRRLASFASQDSG
mmetsp:Transcript_26422/g.77640  ORF Transcript_26422/g.77640 Transcript_26422/m.77640 type:complete len:466 (+) Transcript_26422:57-1454(+)